MKVDHETGGVLSALTAKRQIEVRVQGLGGALATVHFGPDESELAPVEALMVKYQPSAKGAR